MPRLTEAGWIGCGVAGAGFSVGRSAATLALVAPGAGVTNGVNWMDATRLAYQTCAGGRCRIEAWDVSTGRATELDPEGTNFFACGAGQYVAFLHGCRGYLVPRYMPASGVPYEIAPDGTLAFKPEYQASGGLAIAHPGHGRWELTMAAVGNVHVLGWNRVSWTEHDRPQSTGLAPLQALPAQVWGLRRRVLRDGREVALYQTGSTGALVLQWAQRPIGLVVQAQGDAFRPDVLELPDGRLWVVWATTEAELPGQVRELYVRPTELTHELDRVSVAVPAPPPPPPPVPTPPRQEKPMYRNGPTVVEYIQRRWQDFGIPARTAALAAQRGVSGRPLTQSDLNAMWRTDQRRAEGLMAEFEAFQVPAFIHALGELHHVLGWRDIGAGRKTSGHHFHGMAVDIVAFRPLSGTGPDEIADVVVAMGGPEASIEWHGFLDRNPDRTWMIPPMPAGGIAAPVPSAAGGRTVTFRCHDQRHYLCAEEEGKKRINATRTAPGGWETFQLETVEGGVALRAVNGKYVCAENGGGTDRDPGHLIANREAAGPWETFTVHEVEGGIALQAHNGRFVCAERGGGGEVVVNRTAPGAWETFAW